MRLYTDMCIIVMALCADGANRYGEVLLHIHTLAFALGVGLLQSHKQAQAILSVSLSFIKLCYLCSNPFNEYLRWVSSTAY